MSERDLIGYGGRPPLPRWPGEARVAVQFVLNIEEGAESCILNGDARSEAYLHELPGRPARTGERDLSVEGMYEYGSRAGVWRILELFNARGLPLTAFAVGRALELNPEIGQRAQRCGARGRRAWLPLAGLSRHPRRRGAAPYPPHPRSHRTYLRQAPRRLVHGAGQSEHAPSVARGRRVPLQLGRVQR